MECDRHLMFFAWMIKGKGKGIQSCLIINNVVQICEGTGEKRSSNRLRSNAPVYRAACSIKANRSRRWKMLKFTLTLSIQQSISLPRLNWSAHTKNEQKKTDEIPTPKNIPRLQNHDDEIYYGNFNVVAFINWFEPITQVFFQFIAMYSNFVCLWLFA